MENLLWFQIVAEIHKHYLWNSVREPLRNRTSILCLLTWKINIFLLKAKASSARAYMKYFIAGQSHGYFPRLLFPHGSHIQQKGSLDSDLPKEQAKWKHGEAKRSHKKGKKMQKSIILFLIFHRSSNKAVKSSQILRKEVLLNTSCVFNLIHLT